MFTPGVTVNKMLKMTHSLYEPLITVCEKNVNASDRSYWVFFQKMVWLKGSGVTIREILMVEVSKKLLSQQKIPKPCTLKDWYLANGSSETNNL